MRLVRGGGASSPHTPCTQQERDAKWRQEENRDFAKCCRNLTGVTTTPRKGAGSAHPHNEEKLEELCKVPGAVPLPWHEDQPCTPQVIGCSGLLQVKYSLFMECFLHYRCTGWSWCLLQAQRSKRRAVHGFTLQSRWCNTHRLWNTDSGDNHWFEES